MKKYKVLFCDLDGALTDTLSGETSPKGIWDMKYKLDVLDAIKKLEPECVLIVNNQGEIEKGVITQRDFEFKMEYIIRSVKAYTKIFTEYSYCASNSKDNYYRMPNVGMLEWLLRRCQTKWFKHDNIDKVDCLMIGNASGLDGQLSDIDKKTAENFGIDYLDIDDFISLYIEN